MLRRSLRCFDYRTERLADKSSLVISKKEVDFDHVAIDTSGLVGVGLRLAKTVGSEGKRQREVARHVAQGIYHVLSRFHPKKTLSLFMDGSEILWKAHKTRASSVTRKTESRLARLPGTQLMQVVEDKIIKMMPENRQFPPEVVFSGTCTDGPMEQKLTAWALDVASRERFKPTDSLLLVGGSELFLNSLALTPFYNVVNVVQSGSDFKQTNIQDILQWLNCGERAKAGDNAYLSKVRTDVVLLYILCHGASVSELSGIPTLIFADLMDKYLNTVNKVTSSSSAANQTSPFLFEERGNGLHLNIANLKAVLEKVVSKSIIPMENVACDDVLELALQTHAMLCSGVLPSPRFMCRDSAGGTTNISPAIFANHLAYLLAQNADSQFVTAKSETKEISLTTGPLTAAEYTILSQPQAADIEKLVQQVVGKVMKPETAKKILTKADPNDAAKEIRRLMTVATRPHRCLHFSPSYCWLQNEKSKLWNFVYIDLGERQRKMETRSKRNEEAGSVLTINVASDGPAIFDAQKQTWEPIPSFPFHLPPSATIPSPAEVNVASSTQKPKTLSLLSWNVMFDRYSGKPTPLGMPGIDWCSLKRYPVLAKLIKECDADVVGMQEVEPQFWEYLAALPWVRQNYYFSCNVNGPAVNPWGVLMMVHRRVPVSHITHHNIPAWSGHLNLMPVVSVDMAHGPVNVAAMHLLAPYTKGHENARVGQDNALKQRMLKTIAGDCITMGDFNDWPTNEFSMEPNSNYTDAWTHLYPKDLGKTMDETNTFAKLKIEELFFGRADKVFYRSKKLRPTVATLVGMKSVNTENANSDAPAYLFPSDHYGIHIKFTSDKV